jgi:hypothetical protein
MQKHMKAAWQLTHFLAIPLAWLLLSKVFNVERVIERVNGATGGV